MRLRAANESNCCKCLYLPEIEAENQRQTGCKNSDRNSLDIQKVFLDCHCRY